MTGQPPAVVRGAVAVWLALGVFLVLENVVLWLRRDEFEQAAARAGDDPAAVSGLLVQLTVVALVFTVGYGLFGRLLRQGRRWSRGVLTGVAVLHVLWIVLPGASAVNLVTLLLIAVGLAFTWLPGTAQWVKQH
ncbi:hypothetical protein ADK67_05920 [Saccharothrix sp. NRRL B-16348]|jgi:hypothetical protein|uniref:hypothetical protein n=1 Tax=Saccharothrix sp. NRRL B-16348 TaxID=1415542 RepID=UPI0006AEE22B|nr:hypothetical protein [Saccharothrix sp. NRRL B-16348]KOX33832.1 hypothetical protein ADK67_05920 [Saccharothrix sp. NRRL B-16348]